MVSKLDSLRWVLGLACAVGAASAGAAEPWKTPRTSWGDPDLHGIYSNDDETGTPMERPKDYEGLTLADVTPEKLKDIVAKRQAAFDSLVNGKAREHSISPPPHLIFDNFERKNSRPWLITDPSDGKIPALTAEAQARPRGAGRVSKNANPNGPFNSYLDMGLYDRCITRGIPASMMPAGYGSRYEIVQAPGVVAIRYEMIHETRVIPLDTRPHVPDGVRQYLGDARGYFDGDTLVVETTNFRADSAPQRASAAVKMTERFKRTAASTVEWSVARTWTRPWTYSMLLKQVDASQQIYEYACHEGNLAMRNILSGARAADAAAVAGQPAPKASAPTHDD